MNRLLFVVALLCPVFVWPVSVSPAFASAEEAGAPPAGPRPAVSEIVTADPTRERMFPGVIEAAHETNLAFQTIGRIASLDAAPGDLVDAGQVLATLDRVSLQEDVASAEAALSSARAAADFAEQSYSRARALADRDIATKADVEKAEANRNATAAQVKAAEADLTSAREALSYGSLSAPEAGVVLDTPVEQGTVVSAGTTVVTLADLKGREAVIDVPSEFLALLAPDAAFRLSGHEGADDPVMARLRLIEPVADDTLRGRRLRLAIDDDQDRFRIGSLVSATYAAVGDEIITLPQSAITGGPDQPTVWRVTGPARTVNAIPVTLGSAIGDRIEVMAGVSVGDEIIVKGANSLEEGQSVGERAQ
ncbi:efflux RND transporter periplasmic adaptor subunit [Pseudooceanicola sediminis]|uniref:Efflux RND transporter periplasmic adaptor subunit n=1 Tax=Pseudooceanicola sediminis TaxID=2211117 RepID=A0A399JB63_9RHOB|nr:efflux RND transporter periplasmic adaptor subunit [Pseudooceanicola sediminis]KAA2314258.1 efflux RND transporter periplasmic adaptor subunit [Puniceibacterium sp. HSS470]RII39886.1 efflux RND transporter periplasmic adaptor subunit [Pseudooceanicola sediminis]|tara:strand:+ start:23980 stop:25071 length:1092 start_codon:yes stop_codon:yes gene_type:complete